MHDLVVVGGGPVGLATALYAARSGLSVVVLEPRVAPIDKACGEGIMPAGRAALTDLGVPLVGREFRGIRYTAAGAEEALIQATADFTSGAGIGVARTTLHAAFAVAAAGAGVEVVRATATAIGAGTDGVRVRTGSGPEVEARYLVGADGLHSRTRRLLGLERPGARLRRYGLREHVRCAPWSEYVEVHWGRRGEAYVTPLGGDLVGVAVLSTTRAPMAVQLGDFPTLAPHVAGAPLVGGVRGAGPLRQRSTARTSGRCLLVGDASGYIDALTGEGISVGLAQARAAVAAVCAQDVPAYEREWRRVTRSYAVATILLLQVTRPVLGRRAIVPAAARFPGLFGAIVDRIGGTGPGGTGAGRTGTGGDRIERSTG